MASTPADIAIGQVSGEHAARLAAALVGDYPEEEQGNLALHLLRADSREPPGKMWGASWSGRNLGACAAELQAGNVGYITGPTVFAGELAAVGDALLQAAITWCGSQGAVLLQSLLPSATHPAAEFLLRAGFEHRSDLLYLVALCRDLPEANYAHDLGFEAFQLPADADRLGQIVARTYIASLDSPQGADPRSVRETLAGYAASGGSGQSLWWILRKGESDVGCLLLADYPQLAQWEVVYVGLVPEARGNGWGLQAVRHAQQLAKQAGRERVVLAVDEANRPALAMYARAGFEAWNRRAVFLRKVANRTEKIPSEGLARAR